MDAFEVLVGLGNLAAAAGILVALVQLRSVARQRQEEMVLRVYAPFLEPEFSRAYWRVHTWKYETFEQWDAEATVDDKAALNVVRILFETIGVLHKRGLADIDFLADLLASPTILTWNRIAPIMRGYREKVNAPDWSRSHEELANALDLRLSELGQVHPAIEQPAASSPGHAGS
jgi:hypothetical protein